MVCRAMKEPTEEQDQAEKVLEECCAKLSEHWENVQIFVNRDEEGGETFSQLACGTGSWHARQNQAREWIITGEEMARCKARKNWRIRDEGDEDHEDDD